MLTCPRQAHVLVDKHSRAFGLLAGRPNDPTWDDTAMGAAEALRVAKDKLNFGKRQDRRAFEPKKGQDPAAAPFRTVADGGSYGGGQRVSRLRSGDWLG